MDDIHQQLLAAFEVEHRDHVEAIRAALQGDAAPDMREVFRRAHSLKGAARAVDLPAVEELAHRLEALFARVMEDGLALQGGVIDAVHLALDAIEVQAAAVRVGRSAPPTTPALQALDRALGVEADAASPPPAAAIEEAPAESPAPDHGPEHVRVEADQLAGLSRAMHQLSAELQEQDGVAAGLRRLQADARRLERLWGDLRRQASEGAAATRARDFDEGLKSLRREIGEMAVRQARAGWAADQGARDMRARIERISLTPAETVFDGLGRMVREIARDAGAEVEVRLSGLGVQADRRVLQALKDPVIHLLRNAVSHGLEPAAARLAQGKPERMTVGLEISTRSGRLDLAIWDDGRGPDLARLQAAAVARGQLATGADMGPPSEDELLALAFAPGLSTAEVVDRLSGRGMGLSVVAEAVRDLRGTVRLSRGRPAGARIEISVPFSAARQTLVLVECAGGTFALPSFGVRRLLRLPAQSLETVDGHPAARIVIGGADVTVPVVSLCALIEHPAADIPVESGVLKAVLIQRGERRLAVAVEAFQDVRESLVEDLDSGVLDPGLTAGAVLLEDDIPALVLNPDALVERWLRSERTLAARGLGLASREEAPQLARTILVVDDSITTRTLEKSILEAQGYRVVLAVDGLDGLNQLRSGAAAIDLVVADIEMPRMDGFSLLQAIKADASLAALPVILMTSRSDPQDVRRGLDLGAEAYLTKQKFDQRELLATIGRLL